MAEDDDQTEGLTPETVHTVVEFHIVLTDALKERDLDKVLRLRRHTQDWLQMDDERDAQADLCDAVAELIGDYRVHTDLDETYPA